MQPSDFPIPIAAPDLHLHIDAGGESLWGPYIRRGHRTLFSAHPKTGKTTLIAHVLRSMGEGGYLAGEIVKGTALVVTEESNRLWARRVEKLEIGNHISVVGKNVLFEWEWRDLCFGIAHACREYHYDLVVIDTFAAFCGLEDENSSAQVMGVMNCLQPIMEQNAAILLVHHCRKSGGSRGMAVRGSTALTGSADILLEMKFTTKTDREDGHGGRRHRKLVLDSRFDDIEPVIIELAENGCSYLEGSRVQIITRLLPEDPPGMTAKELLSKWPVDNCPRSVDSLNVTLVAGEANDRLWSHTGGGRKGDPCRYYRSRI